jgi:hypothetical protein
MRYCNLSSFLNKFMNFKTEQMSDIRLPDHRAEEEITRSLSNIFRTFSILASFDTMGIN